MHPEVRAQQPIGCRTFVLGLRHRQHPKRAVAEEDELATRPQDAGRLGDPAVRIGPDGGAVLADSQIEKGIGQAGVLGVAVDQREVEVVLVFETARRLQLLGGVVDSGDAGTAPGEPGAEVASPLARQVCESAGLLA